MEVKKCDVCNITYVDNYSDNVFNCEVEQHVIDCPLCRAQEELRQQRNKANKLSKQLSVYQTCEQCMSTYGYCDRERNTCEKLKNYF